MNVENPKLQALVADRKGDRSYEQLAALSGGRLSRARIQQIATRDMKAFPDAATLAGLAQALDVPVQEVVLASARSLGLEVRGGAAGDALLVPGGRLLSTPAQDALLTMARELSKTGAQDDQREAETVANPPQSDGINGQADGERRRGGTVRATPFRKGRGGRTSGSRPKLVSDDVNDDVLELPYAADNSEDPGEDYR